MWHKQVSEYDSAIVDIANFASDHILWIDPASNYAVYNAAGVNILATDLLTLVLRTGVRNTSI